MPEQDSITEAHELAVRGHIAARAFASATQEDVDRITAAMARAGTEAAERLGQLAAEETGYGRAAHKTFKNVFNTQWVYEGFKDERTVGVIENDRRAARDHDRRAGRRDRGPRARHEPDLDGALQVADLGQDAQRDRAGAAPARRALERRGRARDAGGGAGGGRAGRPHPVDVARLGRRHRRAHAPSPHRPRARHRLARHGARRVLLGQADLRRRPGQRPGLHPRLGARHRLRGALHHGRQDLRLGHGLRLRAVGHRRPLDRGLAAGRDGAPGRALPVGRPAERASRSCSSRRAAAAPRTSRPCRSRRRRSRTWPASRSPRARSCSSCAPAASATTSRSRARSSARSSSSSRSTARTRASRPRSRSCASAATATPRPCTRATRP